jgi:hypothetical protein
MNINTAPPLFEIDNAHVSLSFATFSGVKNYRVLVKETRNGETRSLLHNAYDKDKGVAGGQSLFVGYSKKDFTTKIQRTEKKPQAFSANENTIHHLGNRLLITTGISQAKSNPTILTLFDLSGRIVVTLTKENLGNSTFEFPLTKYPSGYYVFKIQQGAFSQTQQLVINK